MKAQEQKFLKTWKFYTVYVIVRCVTGKGGHTMTANEVAYWQLQESKRHNAATEGLTSDIQEAQKERFRSQSSADLTNAAANRANSATNKANAIVNMMNAFGNAANGGLNFVSGFLK